jgi:ABC-type multidrug transport system fused ATPase/permease subunit
MFNTLIELYSLLAPQLKRRLIILQFFVLIMSALEVIGVLSIGPFMALVSNPDQIEGEGMLAQLYLWSDAPDPNHFLIWAGAASLIALTVSTVMSMYTLRKLTIDGQLIGDYIGNQLYIHYLNQTWIFHTVNNSSYLTSKISHEASRVSTGIINPFLHLSAKLIMSIIMSIAMFLYNPLITLIGILVFSLSYALIYKVVKNQLSLNGDNITKYQAKKFKLLAEGIGGIKDIILMGRQQRFVDHFHNASFEASMATSRNHFLSLVPRYAVELVFYGAVIILILYLTSATKSENSNLLPVLSFYALATMKLLPAFQQIYYSTAQIKASLPAYVNIKNDLKSRQTKLKLIKDLAVEANSNINSPKKSIQLKNVKFKYNGNDNFALNDISICIPVKKMIGIVGSSGSGKTTAIDVLMGLITPDEGHLLIDEIKIDQSNMLHWRKKIGYVSQSIYLSDSTVRENIAFGLAKDEINEQKLLNAVNKAQLKELIAKLPYGIETTVGERGVQLSGGERQRIGIARALYNEAEVLVFDEATSALDGVTEKLVMDAVHETGRGKTIVLVAHRLTTVKKCDWIYMLDKGRIIDEGTYDSLLENNKVFRSMSNIT